MKEFVAGSVVEFVYQGMSFMGEFKSVDDKKVYLTNVLSITVIPMPAPNGQGIVHAPKFGVPNFFSIEKDEWSFDLDDINYISSEIGSVFIEHYKTHVEGYKESKIREGSNIQVVQNMDNLQQDIKKWE